MKHSPLQAREKGLVFRQKIVGGQVEFNKGCQKKESEQARERFNFLFMDGGRKVMLGRCKGRGMKDIEQTSEKGQKLEGSGKGKEVVLLKDTRGERKSRRY